jgi:hypothetical protein
MNSNISNISDFLYWFDFTLAQAVVYLTGPFRAFDYFLSNDIASNYILTLGRSTFGGIEEFFSNILIILEINIETANSIYASFAVPPIIIGQNTSFNAFYTGLTNFYLDGRFLGVVFFSFIFGIIAALVWNNFNRYKNLMSFSLLIFITKNSIAYMYRWDYNSPTYWFLLSIFVFYTMIYKKKNYGGKIKNESWMASKRTTT